ncbi:bath-40 [Symbiodinium sp. CCMP2456]|nr:bath-40 [Symbiodinium sp. CCMP2456]
MLKSEDFVERQQAQVVISDFSSGAVEIFLRVLYSGVVRGPLETLVEVSSMADKYQVKRLLELCTEALQDGLSPANACELFAAAAQLRTAGPLEGWSCKKRKAGEEETLPSPLQPIADGHMGRMEDELARFTSEYGPA